MRKKGGREKRKEVRRKEGERVMGRERSRVRKERRKEEGGRKKEREEGF